MAILIMLKEKSNMLYDIFPIVKGNLMVWGIALNIVCLTQKNVILDFYEFISFLCVSCSYACNSGGKVR